MINSLKNTLINERNGFTLMFVGLGDGVKVSHSSADIPRVFSTNLYFNTSLEFRVNELVSSMFELDAILDLALTKGVLRSTDVDPSDPEYVSPTNVQMKKSGTYLYVSPEIRMNVKIEMANGEGQCSTLGNITITNLDIVSNPSLTVTISDYVTWNQLGEGIINQLINLNKLGETKCL